MYKHYCLKNSYKFYFILFNKIIFIKIRYSKRPLANITYNNKRYICCRYYIILTFQS